MVGMDETRLIRKIEDDQFIIHFFFECNYLMNIDVEVKDRENIPAIDLENRTAVSQWVFQIHGAIQRAMSRVPEKTLAIKANKTISSSDIDGGFICTTCEVPLIKKGPCCGSGKPTLRCPKCGVAYRAPEKKKDPGQGPKGE